MASRKQEKILAIAGRQGGLVATRDVENLGLPRTYLYRLCEKGMLTKVGHGLYSLPEPAATEHLALVEVSKRVPKAVICLVSALSFHGITTQIPHEVWIAVQRGSWQPDFDYPPLNVTHVSGPAFSFGVETHRLSGVAVNVYNPAKTVVDCFKFRNKVGLDVVIEALREVWRTRKATMDELVRAAEVCRVSRVIRPYLEAIT